MKTKKDWVTRLQKMRRNVYLQGEKVARDDERMQAVIDTTGMTFDLAEKPEHADLLTATSHLTGGTINRFCHIHQNKIDLHKKQDMTRFLCQQVGGCIQRCMGIDAANAVSSVSFEADKVNKGTTEYYNNFLKWLRRFQEENLVGCCAQTDVKGNRTQRPGQQKDPDAYVHVVEKKSDGIVVRGCKTHITISSQADEVLVIPTRALQPD